METWLPIVNDQSHVRTVKFFSVAACLLLSGCSDQMPTYPVSGQVRFANGGVVHVGTVELKSREHNLQARGQIESDGSFTLTTYKEGDGAVAGMHDCVIVQFVMAEGISGHKPSKVGVVDRRYASYATSGLKAEIVPDKKNELILKVDGLLSTQPQNHKHN